MREFILIIGIILLVIGVKFIYDARPIVKIYFGQSKENDTVLIIKIVGLFLSIGGAALLYSFL